MIYFGSACSFRWLSPYLAGSNTENGMVEESAVDKLLVSQQPGGREKGGAWMGGALPGQGTSDQLPSARLHLKGTLSVKPLLNQTTHK